MFIQINFKLWSGFEIARLKFMIPILDEQTQISYAIGN